MANSLDQVDDSDLEDLLTRNNDGSTSPLQIDSSRTTTTINSNTPSPLLSYTPLGLICTLCTLFNHTCPKLTKLLLVFTLLSLTFLLINPTMNNHTMGSDYSTIQSAYDLSLSKVHHWCIRGDNDSCRCEDPLEPSPRAEFKSWNAAHKANVAEVDLYRALYGERPVMVDEVLGRPREPIDVAFLGESVVEAMDGRWLGKHVIGRYNRNKNNSEKNDVPMIHETFEQIFRKDKGGPYEGVALGIAGDTTANVLWRIMNDEMPYDFNPKVWWLVLGMNDLTRMQCSEEIVVLGILRVVEEIRLRKPDAKIVINSLLPMVNYQGGGETTMADAADFTANDKGRNSRRYRRKEDRYGAERKREVPPTFQVRGGNDDQVAGGGNRRRLKIKKRENESDEEYEERRERKMKKRKKKRKKRNDDEEEEEEPPQKMTKKQREEKEDNATEGEALEKAIERKKKKLYKEDKRARVKVFKDDEKYHPRKPVSKFFPMIKKKVLPPVWPSVHLINDKLKEFCTKHESITFFDTTDIFASKEEGGRHHLYNELISPRGHPTELGFERWEQVIKSYLTHLIPEEEEKVTSVNSDKVMGDDDYVEAEVIVEEEGSQVISDGATDEEDENDDTPPAGALKEDDDEVDEKDGVEVVDDGATEEDGTDDATPAGALQDDDEDGGKKDTKVDKVGKEDAEEDE